MRLTYHNGSLREIPDYIGTYNSNNHYKYLMVIDTYSIKSDGHSLSRSNDEESIFDNLTLPRSHTCQIIEGQL